MGYRTYPSYFHIVTVCVLAWRFSQVQAAIFVKFKFLAPLIRNSARYVMNAIRTAHLDILTKSSNCSKKEFLRLFNEGVALCYKSAGHGFDFR
jgi:hypothetical protein